MLIYCYAALFAVGMVSVFLNQKYSRNTNSYYEIFVYAMITGVIGCTVFAVSSGFKLDINGIICMYAVFYASAAFISYFTVLQVYRYMAIAEVGVCTGSISLVVTSLFGFVVFGENVTLIAVLRIILMLCATFAVYFAAEKGNGISDGNKSKLVGIIICIISSFGGVIATVTTKSFAADTRVSDTNSFFFMTNVVIVAVSGIIVLILKVFGKSKGKREKIKLWQYIIIVLNTVASNISSVLSVVILGVASVSMHVPVSGAISLIASQTVSAIYGEKPKILPLAFALCAVLLGLFE